MAIERGDIFWHDFGVPQDSRQGGARPVLVVQSDSLNRIVGYTLTVIVPLTTKERPAATFARIEPTLQNGLKSTSWAICNQLFTVPKADLSERSGRVSPEVMEEVERGISITLGITRAR